jgi:hypothetical protein
MGRNYSRQFTDVTKGRASVKGNNERVRLPIVLGIKHQMTSH